VGTHTPRNRLGDLVEIPEIPATQAKNTFGALSTSFDDLLERLQAPGARQEMKAAFNASPEELGRAAVEAAKQRY
jgi:antitoxin Phd